MKSNDNCFVGGRRGAARAAPPVCRRGTPAAASRPATNRRTVAGDARHPTAANSRCRPAAFVQPVRIRPSIHARYASSLAGRGRPDIGEVVRDIGEQRTVELRILPHQVRPVAAVEGGIADPGRQLVREAARNLERILGVKVDIQDRKGKGKIILKYSSLEDFDRIMEALSAESKA